MSRSSLIVKYCTTAQGKTLLKQGVTCGWVGALSYQNGHPWVNSYLYLGEVSGLCDGSFLYARLLGNKKGGIPRRIKYVFCYTNRQFQKRASTCTNHSLLNVYFPFKCIFKCVFSIQTCDHEMQFSKVEDCFYFVYINYTNYSANIIFFFFSFTQYPFLCWPGQGDVSDFLLNAAFLF